MKFLSTLEQAPKQMLVAFLRLRLESHVPGSVFGLLEPEPLL